MNLASDLTNCHPCPFSLLLISDCWNLTRGMRPIILTTVYKSSPVTVTKKSSPTTKTLAFTIVLSLLKFPQVIKAVSLVPDLLTFPSKCFSRILICPYWRQTPQIHSHPSRQPWAPCCSANRSWKRKSARWMVWCINQTHYISKIEEYQKALKHLSNSIVTKNNIPSMSFARTLNNRY